jgi:hypothetical protein
MHVIAQSSRRVVGHPCHADGVEEESMQDKHEVGPDVDLEAEDIRDRRGAG